MTAVNWNTVIDEALAASDVAISKYLAENKNWYPCGFAWVKISPARGPLVGALKARNLGRVDSYAGGFSIGVRSMTQAMLAKEEGCYAMTKVFEKYGVNCSVQTRID
jgi:hypothetical protein